MILIDKTMSDVLLLQVVSTMLINLIPRDKPRLSLVGKSSIAEKV